VVLMGVLVLSIYILLFYAGSERVISVVVED